MLCLHFWQLVYFNEDHRSFPSGTTETRGRFVGISENFGHDMTFKILNYYANKIISRYSVRPVDGYKSSKLRADPLISPEAIKSFHDDSITNTSVTASKCNESPSSSTWTMLIIDPSDLVVGSFLISNEDGQHLRSESSKPLMTATET